MFSWPRASSFTFLPCTWLEAFSNKNAPRTASPRLVKTVQPSPSTVFQANPPIFESRSRPLVLISLTMAPSVSTCAVRPRGSPP